MRQATLTLLCGRCLTLAGLVAACMATGPALAHSLRVAPAAADHATHVLELSLDDSTLGTPADAYIAVGPERGLADETAVEVALSLDLGRLTAAGRDGRSGALAFLQLAQHAEAGGARVVLFLVGRADQGWSLGAWSWDDSSAHYVLAGLVPLTSAAATDAGSWRRLALEWRAASSALERGSLRVWRVDHSEQRTLLFERSDLDNARQTLNLLQLGVRGADRAPGVAGVLAIDTVTIRRVASAAVEHAAR